jgi:hypothetical protein
VELQEELVTLQEQRKQAEEDGDKKETENLADDILKMEEEYIPKQKVKWQKAASETETKQAELTNIVTELKLVREKIIKLTFEWKFNAKA